MINICAFSDGHGLFPKEIKPFDLMLIGGDNVPLYYQRSKEATKQWYLNDFVDWINKLPFNDSYSKVIVISGNHEIGMSQLKPEELSFLWSNIKAATDNRVIYRENESYDFRKNDEHLLIFGTPYCKIFGNWAYMATQETLNDIYSYIPENCDILLSHDAPYGVSDMCYGWKALGETPQHIGNKSLREAILDKRPKINIHGHLHSANHEREILGNTDVYCVSLVDENYVVNYEPLYLEI